MDKKETTKHNNKQANKQTLKNTQLSFLMLLDEIKIENNIIL